MRTIRTGVYRISLLFPGSTALQKSWESPQEWCYGWLHYLAELYCRFSPTARSGRVQSAVCLLFGNQLALLEASTPYAEQIQCTICGPYGYSHPQHNLHQESTVASHVP